MIRVGACSKNNDSHVHLYEDYNAVVDKAPKVVAWKDVYAALAEYEVLYRLLFANLDMVERVRQDDGASDFKLQLRKSAKILFRGCSFAMNQVELKRLARMLVSGQHRVVFEKSVIVDVFDYCRDRTLGFGEFIRDLGASDAEIRNDCEISPRFASDEIVRLFLRGELPTVLRICIKHIENWDEFFSTLRSVSFQGRMP